MCKDGKENISSDSGQGLAWALALFLKNQRKWESSPLDEDGVKKFRKLMLERDMGGEPWPQSGRRCWPMI